MSDTRTATKARGANREGALKSLYDDISSRAMFPFWATSTDVEHDEVKQLMATQKAVPFLWSYEQDIKPILYRAAELITMDDSERRSLVLVNPGLNPKRATVTTMYTAYRLNDANEVMPPHKHSPNAIRFGLTGKTNFTGIDGEDITFGPGDLVLTPNDTWHNHGNVGDEPAVNLSVLDLPLVETLNAIHFDHDYYETVDGKPVRMKQQTARYSTDYSQKAYGAGGMVPRFVDHTSRGEFSSPMHVYRWDQMRSLLERFRNEKGCPYEGVSIEYTDPHKGGPVYLTITFFAQMLRPGERTLPLKQTASLLCAPFEGSGYSIIDGQRFDWKQFDTLAVPGGCWVEHVNGSSSQPAVLFTASDEPALKAFKLYKKWGREPNGEAIRLV